MSDAGLKQTRAPPFKSSKVAKPKCARAAVEKSSITTKKYLKLI